MFSAYDLQCHRYFAVGRNSQTRKECEDLMVEFLLEGSGLSEEDIQQWQKAGSDAILGCFEVRVDKHKEQIRGE